MDKLKIQIIMLLSVGALVAGVIWAAGEDPAPPFAQETVPSISIEAESEQCEDVRLEVAGSDEPVSATNIEATNTSCEIAQIVAGRWAQQQVGGADAQLPTGWSCDSSSICREGIGVVTFSLSYG